MKTIRLTLRVTGNAHEEGDAIAEFLFARCPGNAAEAGVLAFIRRTKAEAAAYPGTGASHTSPAMKRLFKAAED